MSNSFISKAEFDKPTQIHDLSMILLNRLLYSSGATPSLSNSFIFKCWYCREAVQIGLSVNSVFETRYFLGQELPGVSLSTKDNFSIS